MTTYVNPNFKSKKALKEAVKAGQVVTVFQAGMGEAPTNGKACVCGPHYPEAHKWYGEATVVDGRVTKVS